MFSGAEKAEEIRKQIVTVYQAWRKGHLKPDQPSIPTDYASANRTAQGSPLAAKGGHQAFPWPRCCNNRQ